jgi:4-hydroxybenzoate polyprenyltransferase
VIGTEGLICSTCGTHIDAQNEIDKFERLQADVRKAVVRRKKRKLLVARFHLHVLGVMALAGLMLHEIGRIALLAFVVFGAIALYLLIRRTGLDVAA